MLKGFVHQLPHGAGLGFRLGEGHLEDLLARGVQDLVQASRLLVGQAHGLACSLDELSQGPFLRHDAGVVLRIGGGGGGLGKLDQVADPSQGFQLPRRDSSSARVTRSTGFPWDLRACMAA